MAFFLLKLFLRHCEYLFAHQRRHRHLNPLSARPFVSCTIAARQASPLPQGARDLLPGTQFGFPIACRSTIGGVAEHTPNRGPLPAPLPRPGCNLALIQQTSDRLDAETLLGID